MNPDLTVIYYTANRERPEFETRICRSLRHTTRKIGLPVVSVSQKPLDLGQNICVGNVGWSGHNALRQYQTGARAAKTRFVCAAESDFLYPAEYYRFHPKADDVFYMASPVYFLCRVPGRPVRFYPVHPNWREAASIVGREYLIQSVDDALAGKGMWHDGVEHGADSPDLLSHKNRQRFRIATPIVTFKTAENMHKQIHDNAYDCVNELPYWGRWEDVVKKYCG